MMPRPATPTLMSSHRKALIVSLALHGAVVVGLGIGGAGGAVDASGLRVAFMPQHESSPAAEQIEDSFETVPMDPVDAMDIEPPAAERAEDELRELLKSPSTVTPPAPERQPGRTPRAAAWWGEPGAWDVAWERNATTTPEATPESVEPATYQALWYHPPTPRPAPREQENPHPADTQEVPVAAPAPASTLIEATLLTDSNQAPRYPRAASRLGQEGTVWVLAQVDAEGRVIGVELDTGCGFPLLHRAALSAVQKWRFTPARDSSGAIPSQARVPVVFRIRG